MHYLLFTLAFLWFAFIAPLKVTLAVCVSLLLVTSLVRVVASKVIGPTTYVEAFKAICLAFVFLVIGVVLLSSVTATSGAPLVLIILGFLVAYVLGFKLGLQASFGSSAVVAGISTVGSVVLYLVLKPLLN